MLGIFRPRYKLKVNASSLTESPLPATLPESFSAFGATGTGNGQFNHPGDVAVDSTGNLWVVDTNNNRVEEFSTSGAYLATVGSEGTTNGKFKRPTAIAIDANDDIWVADSGNKRVEEFSHAGVYLRKFGTPGIGNGQFAGVGGPEGIAIDYHGNIWVSDTYGGRLEEFNDQGEFKRSVGIHGSGVGQMIEPSSIDIGPGGNAWVTDWGKNEVLEFTNTGQFVREFGGEGSGNGGFRRPDGISIDSKGDVWVGDQNNERVQEFNQGGEYIGKFGSFGSGSGQFNLGYPIGIATDASGDIWVTDTGNNRVEKWASADYATAGKPTYVTSFGSAGTGAGHFEQVLGLAVDASGNVWAADATNNLLQKFNSKGELLAAYGKAGAGNGELSAPTGLAANSGHIWDAEMFNARLQKFSESGGYLSKFGQGGSAAGQLEYPWGVAIDAAHHVWVTETGPNAVQEFTESGTLLKTLGKNGPGPGEFNGATGIALGPGGKLWVVDIGNNRVQEFTESGTFIRQFGGSESEVGHLSSPMGIYVDPNERVWVADRGNDRVVEFNGAGEYVTQFGTAGSGPGQFNPPEYIAGDSSGHLFVSDLGNHRVQEWSKPALHSQLSTEITVDGKRVDAAEVACEAAACPSQREWTLESSAFAPGVHTVAVKATDGLSNTTTKTMNVEIARDTTKPALEVGGELVSVPAGWIEQEEGNYGLHAAATDSGYGVTSLVFSLDGRTVASKTATCSEGACSAEISTTVNARELSAGAHQAEVAATDGAGNVATRKWTVNVDPEGAISTEEAEATFEALETTAPVNLIGESTEEEIEGTVPGLGVEEVEGEPQGTGGAVPVSLSAESGGEIQMEVAGARTFWSVCEEPEEAGEPEEPREAEEAEKTTGTSGCLPRVVAELRAAEEEGEVARGEKTAGREPITITPVGVSNEESSIVEGVAVVTPNTNKAVDTVTRPLSDGGLNFEDIRSSEAPEHYAFEIEPYGSELELRQVSPQVITAFYKEGGYSAFTLEAEPARDADGHTVPTHLTLNGPQLITLTVEHRGIATETGQPFVYPVVAGTGWQGGFFHGIVEKYMPEEEGTGEEEGEANSENGGSVTIMAIGPPELMAHSSDAWEIEPLSTFPFERRFKFTYCWPKHIPGNPAPPGSFEGLSRPQVSPETSECHREDFEGVRWATTVHGHYEYKTHHWVRVPAGTVECGGWGEQYPAKVHCKVIGVGLTSGPADVIGEWRFGPGRGEWQWLAKPTCYVFGGEIYPREAPSGGHVPYERPPVWFREPLSYAPETCDWDTYEKGALRH